MTQDLTWVVVADGAQVRIFEERVRHGALHERPDFADAQSEEDRQHAAHAKAAVFSKFGPGHSVANDYDPHAQAEQKFLRRLAERLNKGAEGRAFGHLVLIAPPRALGFLREQLTPQASKRLEADAPHACLNEAAETLRRRLHDLRMP